ncbi:hypothetical protein NQ317_011744, partial [Molorchus minor]
MRKTVCLKIIPTNNLTRATVATSVVRSIFRCCDVMCGKRICNSAASVSLELSKVVDRIPPLGDGAPLHWKFSDTQTALCDQGYGSERSPEEEYPPPLPDHDQPCHHHLEPHACYPFITP